MGALLRDILGKVAPGEDESGNLLLTLDLADSFITYRTRYRLEPMPPLLLDLLLIDESNPRSIAFQLARIARHIDSLPQSGVEGGRREEQRLALALLTGVRLADTASLARIEPAGSRAGLQELLHEQASALATLAEAIGQRYFDLVEKGIKWVRAGALKTP